MRVLHVTSYFAPAFRYGGPPRSILGLCRALQRAGVRVEVFTTTANGPAELPASPPEGDRYEGVPVRYFPLAFPRRAFGARGFGAALRRNLGRYDVVHIHGLWNLPVWTAGHCARRAGVPYLISPRGMLDGGSLARHTAWKRLAYWAVERRNLAGAALLHASSELEARTLERRDLGVPVAMLPNAVERSDRGALARGAFRSRLGLRSETPLIAFLGRVHPTKRLDLLAAAFERVRAVRADAALVIAGPDEVGHRRQVEACFAAAGRAVLWTGELAEAEKWSLLHDADALVMCSDSESFGMSVVEALAAGVPVVATHTCPWEELEATGSGFWVPQSAEAVAAALASILDDPAAARAMGARGQALVRTKYSWDSIARAMTEQYRRVAAGAGRTRE